VNRLIGNGPSNGFSAQATELLEFLNEKAGKTYRAVPENLALIEARLRAGATVGDCKAVIARTCREWRGKPEMQEFLRPETLFDPKHFESYLGQAEPETVRGAEHALRPRSATTALNAGHV
jgi:uncharacterized phage protein (TIGR02220 family)